MAAIALFGLVAYRALPVSDLPNVDFPTLLVTAQLPGASPETMGGSVATPLENQFSTIAGLDSMTSVNSLGSTQVTLEFDLNRQIDGAAIDVEGGHHAGRPAAAAGHADAADLHESQSGRSADSLSRDHLRPRCRRGRWTSTPKRASRSASRRSPAWRRCRCSAARSTPCTRRSIRDALAARQHRHQRGRGVAQELERERPDRLDGRRQHDVHAAGDRPADERRRSSAT